MSILCGFRSSIPRDAPLHSVPLTDLVPGVIAGLMAALAFRARSEGAADAAGAGRPMSDRARVIYKALK